MTKTQKVLLVAGFLGIAIGGFVITMYLTRNVRRVRGGIVVLKQYDTPTNEDPLEGYDESLND